MGSAKQKPTRRADTAPTQVRDEKIQSEARRLGRRVMLQFVGEDVPVLDRIEFTSKEGADPEFWKHGDPIKGFSWTEVPQALTLLFLDYCAWGKGDRKVEFFFAGKCHGSLAASLGDAIYREDAIHELFVEKLSSGEVSVVRRLFPPGKGDNVHGKAKDKRDRRISVNQFYLPPECVEVVWQSRGESPLEGRADFEELAKRIRSSVGLPTERLASAPLGEEATSLLPQTPTTPPPHEPVGGAPRTASDKPPGPTEESIPDTIKSLFTEGGKLAEAHRDAEAKAKYEEALNHPDATDLPIFRLKAKMGVASVLRRHNAVESRKLFLECLHELPATASDRLREELLGRLGELEAHAGDLLEARAYLSEAKKLATRLGDDLCLASNLEALATLERRHGRLDEATSLFDQAAELFMVEYQRHDSKTEKQALTCVGICLTNKSLVQQQRSDLLGALSSLERAIESFRKANIQDHRLAETLILFAEAKFADEKWQEGMEALQEALQSATNRDDYVGICKCLRLRGKVRNTFQDGTGALGDFAAALDLMRKRGRPDQLLDHLDKVAHVAAEQGLKDEARKLLIEAKEIAEKHERWEDCADAILKLAEMEDGSDADEKRKEALRTAIGLLEKLLAGAQEKGRKAFLVGRIGLLHQRLGDLDNALVRFTSAKQLYEQIGDVWGIVNSLGSLADIKQVQDKTDEEMNLYREILALAEGKPLGDFAARAKNNMGVRLMQTGFLREAQQLLKEADELCRRKHFRELDEQVVLNVRRVQQLIEAHKPAAMDFTDLIRELHEVGAFFPEAKESILMFWYYWRDIELHSNCRSLLGVKLLVSEDETSKFLELSEKLAAYSDLSLQMVSTKYPGFGMDFVPWPKGKPAPDRVAKAQMAEILKTEDGRLVSMKFLRGGIHSSYFETSDEVRSKQTGREAIVICGLARGLPRQAHELMFGQTADALIAKKVAFFPWDRSSTESRLADDLTLAKEQSLIPLYAGHLPETKDVEEVTHASLTFPVIASSADQNRPRVAEVKRKIVRLLGLEDQEAVASLAEIVGALDELRTSTGANECIPMTAHILRFPVHGAMQTHLALVRHTA